MAFLMCAKVHELTPMFADCLASYPHIQVERFEQVILRYNMLPPFLWTRPSCIHSFLIACLSSSAAHFLFLCKRLQKYSVLPRMKCRVHQADQKSFYLEVSFCRHFIILRVYCDRSIVHPASPWWLVIFICDVFGDTKRQLSTVVSWFG